MDVLLVGSDAAGAGNLEIELAGRTNDERTAGRNGDHLTGLTHLPRRLARMYASKNDRRFTGIAGRRHPGVDAEIRRQHHALPVECRSDTFPVFAAGGDEGGDDGDEHKASQRIGVARRNARRGPARLEGAGRGERAFDVRAPQRQRIRVLRGDDELVGDRRRRAMTQPAPAIEPAESVGGRGYAKAAEWNERRQCQQREHDHAGGAAERRQPEPEAKPRNRQEQTDDRRQRRQSGP